MIVAINPNERAADRLEELQKKRKKWLQRNDGIPFVSIVKKNMVRLEKKVSYHLYCAYLILWEHSLMGRNFMWHNLALGFNCNFSDFVKVLKKS